MFVSDTGKSVRWYRDHVGLTVGSEPDLDGRHDRQFSFVRSVIRPVYVEVAEELKTQPQAAEWAASQEVRTPK